MCANYVAWNALLASRANHRRASFACTHCACSCVSHVYVATGATGSNGEGRGATKFYFTSKNVWRREQFKRFIVNTTSH